MIEAQRRAVYNNALWDELAAQTWWRPQAPYMGRQRLVIDELWERLSSLGGRLRSYELAAVGAHLDELYRSYGP